MIMTLDARLIGTRIMQKRKAYRYTQEQLSEMIGYSKNHISSIERGHTTPTTEFIFLICDVFNETPDYFLIGKNSEKSDELTSLINSLLPE